jgi:hypothetical protein
MEANTRPSLLRRKAAVLALCLLAVAALVCSVVDARRGPPAAAAEQELYMSGKEMERAEAKKLNDLVAGSYPPLMTGEEAEEVSTPLRPGGLGVWLGRGMAAENNVYSLNYLDARTNQYYGQDSMSEHAWSPLPDANEPHSVYYNVLAHWTPTDPMAPASPPAASGAETENGSAAGSSE